MDGSCPRLIKLIDMLDYPGFPLAALLAEVCELEQTLKPVRSAGLAGQGAVTILQNTLGGIAHQCRVLGLKAGQINAEELLAKLAAGSPPAAIGAHLGLLSQSIKKELATRSFISLSETEAELYRTPFGRMLKTYGAFPSAKTDIENASRCFALGLGSACVFHCMGVLQCGLHTLAEELKVKFQYSIELENWQSIIEKIEAAIREVQKSRKSDSKDEDLTFYSELAVQFRYFKDAWRNHVCHQREKYDLHQAQSIYTHVCDFMERLSSRLKEVI